MRWWQLAILAVLGPGLLSCATGAKLDRDPIAPALAPSGAEPPIGALVHEWFALLEGQTLASRPLTDLLAEPAFELSLVEGKIQSRAEVRAWLSRLHSAYPEIDYRFDAIRIEPIRESLYRAHFEIDRRAIDTSGVPHISRREHTWLIRRIEGDSPVILQVDERSLLAFPGTGPQIVCY